MALALSARLRRVCRVNPQPDGFDRIPDDEELTFLPLEAIWPSALDTSRSRPKAEVASGYTRFMEGDVLVPKITPTFEASRSVIATGLKGSVGCGTTELHILRPGPALDRRYLLYVTHSRPFLHRGAANMQGVAGQKRVPESFVADFEVRLPPVGEQRAIADFLDRETARIDAIVLLKRKLRDLVAARLVEEVRADVTGASSPVDDGRRTPWLGPVNQDWPVVPLGRLVRFFSGTTFPPDYQGRIEGDHPFVKVADLAAGDGVWVKDAQNWVSLDVVSALGARIVPEGSILYPRVGAALLLNQRRIAARDMIVDDNLRGVQFARGEPMYWRSVLSLLDLAQFATPGLVPSIGEDAVASIPVPSPSDEEQRTIAATLEERRAKYSALLEGLRKQLAGLLERRQSLITAAVTGQVGVTVGDS